MRSAEEVGGPVRVTLHDGVALELLRIDGGGMPLGEMREQEVERGSTGGYEVHGSYMDGTFAMIPQDQIERVELVATGEELEFGSPYFPGHPRPQELA